MEIFRREENDTRISCRFALCHPDSIDKVFFDFLNHLIKNILQNDCVEEITIFEEVPKNMPDFFTVDQIDSITFKAALQAAIDLKRKYWVLDFGDETATVGCNEAIEKFIVKEGFSSYLSLI